MIVSGVLDPAKANIALKRRSRGLLGDIIDAVVATDVPEKSSGGREKDSLMQFDMTSPNCHVSLPSFGGTLGGWSTSVPLPSVKSENPEMEVFTTERLSRAKLHLFGRV